MGGDLPDYTKRCYFSFTGLASELHEIARRLGSPVPSEVGGRVMWFDDFENGFTNWYPVEQNAGDSVALERTYVHEGLQSVALTTDSDSYGKAYIWRDLWRPTNDKVCLSVLWGWDIDQQEARIEIGDHNGTNKRCGTLRYRLQSTELAIETGIDTYTVIDADLEIKNEEIIWVPMRLYVDLATRYYVKAEIAGESYDLTDYEMWNCTGDSGEHLEIVVANYAVNSGGWTGWTGYIDNVAVLRGMI